MKLFTQRIAAALFISTIVLALMILPATSFSLDRNKPLTSQTFIDVAKIALPTVVSIHAKGHLGSSNIALKQENNENKPPQEEYQGPEEFFRRFFFHFGEPSELFPFPGELELTTAGSGIIIRPNGYILTNYHVIQQAEEKGIEVTLHDSRSFSGDDVKVVGVDRFTDLAVLKINADDLPAAEWGNSDETQVGEWVLALGDPLQFNHSVTQGIISAKHRVIGKALIEDLLQTTAIINPGNSGGPLVNLDGKVIGVNMAIASNVARWQGIGFAIPSNAAKSSSDALIGKGRVPRGYIGIGMDPLTPRIASYYGLKEPKGIVVSYVQPDSPADKAGIQRYDVITKVDGKQIEDQVDMLRSIASQDVGKEVTLTLNREQEGKVKELTVTLTTIERPSEEEMQKMQQKETVEQETYDQLGVKLANIMRETETGKVSAGVEVKGVKPDSPAAKAGLQNGDIIAEVNKINIKSIDDYRAALRNVQKGKDHLIMFERDGVTHITTIPQQEK
jgi:serine protease Do